MARQPGETPKGKCFPAAEPGEEACRTSWGLGFDVNLDETSCTARPDHTFGSKSSGPDDCSLVTG